jgi:SsrA-binding protein
MPPTTTRPRQQTPATAEKRPVRTYSTNKRALHEYSILESVEAGLELVGTEVKSIRAGNVNLRDAYARAQAGQIYLWNVYIAPWEQGSHWNHEPRRPRRLLLHTREIGRLAQKSGEAGNTLVPLRLYDRNGKIKIELAIAKGRKTYDKRAAIAERESKRDLDRVMKEAFAR